MRTLILSAIATTALVNGVVIGVAIGGAVAACAYCVAKNARKKREPAKTVAAKQEG